jgi:hypothetical protein
MEDSLSDAIARAKARAEPDLNKFTTVLDAIEFHLDKFAEEGEEQQP